MFGAEEITSVSLLRHPASVFKFTPISYNLRGYLQDLLFPMQPFFMQIGKEDGDSSSNHYAIIAVIVVTERSTALVSGYQKVSIVCLLFIFSKRMLII